MVEAMMAPQDMLTRLRKGNSNEDELIDMLTDKGHRDPLADRVESAAHKRDQDMWTPLHWAAQDGMLRLTVKLLALGATANAADLCGATPLMIAAYNGHVGICEALLKERATDVRQGNGFLNTAVHYAAQRGQAACIEVLIRADAEVDVADKHGDSPLAWAARNGHIEAVHKLLEMRADPEDDNNASEDPIELAQAMGHHAVAAVMEDAVKEEERKKVFARYTELLDELEKAVEAHDKQATKEKKGLLRDYDAENKRKEEGDYFRELQQHKDWQDILERRRELRCGVEEKRSGVA
jgi:hypothetical protein